MLGPPSSFYGEVHIEPEAIEETGHIHCGRTIAGRESNRWSQRKPENEESLSITIKIAASLVEKNFVSLANPRKERTAVSVRLFTGLNVKM